MAGSGEAEQGDRRWGNAKVARREFWPGAALVAVGVEGMRTAAQGGGAVGVARDGLWCMGMEGQGVVTLALVRGEACSPARLL